MLLVASLENLIAEPPVAVLVFSIIKSALIPEPPGLPSIIQ